MNDFLKKIETPYFLFDKKFLDSQLEEIKRAFENYWNNYIVGYSVKTNSLPALANYMQRCGIYAEVVSEDEFQLVKMTGFSDDEIICNGPVKNDSWLSYILDNGIMLNIDSFSEVKYIIEYANSNPSKKIKVGVRVNLDIEKSFKGESKGGSIGSRFGFSYLNKDFSRVVNSLRQYSNIKINGLHLHISTYTRKVAIYQWIVEQFCFLVKEYSLTDIEYLDIGGGFFGGVPDKRNWNNYISGISEILKLNSYTPDNLTLIIEPGVSLLAGCFTYHSLVRDIKTINERSIVLLDGSRIHIDPIFNRKEHIYHVVYSDSNRGGVEKEQLLVGCTCMENDRILSIQNSKEIKVGDYVCFEKVGAYTMTLSPLFINYFPPVYMYNESEEKLVLLRDKWSATELIQRSNLKIIK